MPTLNFPFTAVVGQSMFKLALMLAAINPAIGGVLVSGPRGSAKSTLARSLADIIPHADQSSLQTSPPFITLPLGATEEMLVGTLNLQDVLNAQTVNFQPGLLAKADGGALYVDEVNLLPDNLVDLLLDVAASGHHIIERDGISHQHRAQFLLLGTMNPDEGELRPQLLDRFGFSVVLDHHCTVEERIQIVRLREQFDRHPESFIERYAQQQEHVSQRITKAIGVLAQVSCSDDMRAMIAERCFGAQVEGVRADIVWCRAAMAHAAWRASDGSDSSDDNLAVIEHDILAVEELVLSHRRRESMPHNPPPPPFTRPSEKKPKEGQQQSQDESVSGRNEQPSQQRPQTSGQGDWGAMEPQHSIAAQSKSVSKSIFTASSSVIKTQGHNHKHRSAKHKGQSVISAKGRCGALNSRVVDWFASFIANAGQWPLRQLRYRKAKMAQPVLYFILLDTSASTVQSGFVSHAKAVVDTIAKRAYIERDQLAVMGFGNQQVQLLLAPKKSPKALRRWLDTLSTGGGTPLCEVLQQALSFQRKYLKQHPETHLRTYLITDGRTTQNFAHQSLLGDVVVIDTEQSAVKRGKAKLIAKVLNADYFPLFA